MSTALMKIKEETVDAIALRVQKLQQCGDLDLPVSYSAPNALKSAWLILQNTKDMNKKPVLEVCTRESITNSLLDMVVQGLNPAKRQGYFIAYGDQLTFQRSYFGTMLVARMVDETIPEDGIVAEVIYEGDVFKYKLERGKKIITQHEQEFGNVDKKKIVGAYCVVYDHDGNVKSTVLMTMEEIKQSWKQSKQNPVNSDGTLNASSVHGKFTSEACKKTVINRACKPIINSSNDETLLRIASNRSDEIRAEQTAQLEIDENANQGEIIDIEPTTETVSEIPSKKPEPEPEMKATGTDGPSF